MFRYLLFLVVVASGKHTIYYNSTLIEFSDKTNVTRHDQEGQLELSCDIEDDKTLSFKTWTNCFDGDDIILDTTQIKTGNAPCDIVNNDILSNLCGEFPVTIRTNYNLTSTNTYKITASASKMCMSVVCLWSENSKNPNCKVLNPEFSALWDNFETETTSLSMVTLIRIIQTEEKEGNCELHITRISVGDTTEIPKEGQSAEETSSPEVTQFENRETSLPVADGIEVDRDKTRPREEESQTSPTAQITDLPQRTPSNKPKTEPHSESCGEWWGWDAFSIGVGLTIIVLSTLHFIISRILCRDNPEPMSTPTTSKQKKEDAVEFSKEPETVRLVVNTD